MRKSTGFRYWHASSDRYWPGSVPYAYCAKLAAADLKRPGFESAYNARKTLIRPLIATVLLFVTPAAMAEEIVAILDLEFIEDTGDTAAVLCFDEDDADCGVWATYYLFEAKVDKVISGELPSERFLVLYGQHALKKENFRNVVALLKEREVENPSEPQYRIFQWGEKRTMYCFEKRDDDNTEIDVERNERFSLNCFDQDTYR